MADPGQVGPGLTGILGEVRLVPGRSSLEVVPAPLPESGDVERPFAVDGVGVSLDEGIESPKRVDLLAVDEDEVLSLAGFEVLPQRGELLVVGVGAGEEGRIRVVLRSGGDRLGTRLA